MPEAFERYLALAGHLPTVAECSFAPVLRTTVREDGDFDDAWRELDAVVEKTSLIQGSYHLSVAFLPYLSRLSEGTRRELRAHVLTALSEDSATWRVRSEISRYFTLYLEARVPGAGGDIVASIAAWMADRLLEFLPRDGDYPQRFRENVLEPQLEEAEQIHRFSAMNLLPGRLRYATVTLRHPWSVAMACALGGNLEALRLPRDTDLAKALRTVLKTSLFTIFTAGASREGALPANAFVSSSSGINRIHSATKSETPRS